MGARIVPVRYKYKHMRKIISLNSLEKAYNLLIMCLSL